MQILSFVAPNSQREAHHSPNTRFKSFLIIVTVTENKSIAPSVGGVHAKYFLKSSFVLLPSPGVSEMEGPFAWACPSQNYRK